jgi:hypothetical protein
MPSGSTTPDLLGDITEADVRGWLTRAGLRATKVEKDVDGWDAHVHFSRDSTTTPLKYDLAESDITCLLQIKGTAQTGESPIPVSLSNWLKLAKCPLPTFFVIVQWRDADHNPEPLSVKVVHVGSELISRTLERAAKIENGDPPPQKITMGVPWKDEKPLSRPYGDAIRLELLRHIGPSLEAYVIQKQDWNANTGYEDGNRIGCTMQTTAEMLGGVNVDRAMAEFAVRLRERLPIKIVDMRDMRFGLSRPHDPHGLVGREGGELSSSVVPPLGHGTYAIYFANSKEWVYLDGDVYVSHLYFPFLPKESLISRCVGECFEIVSGKNRIDIKVTLPDDSDAKIEIPVAANAARCVRLATEGQTIDFSVILRIPGLADEQVAKGTGYVSGCKIPDNGLLALEGANYLFEQANVAPSERFVYVRDLITQGERISRIFAAATGVIPEQPHSSFVRLTSIDLPAEVRTGGLTLNFKCILGNTAIAAIMLVHGHLDHSIAGEVQIPKAAISLVRTWSFYKEIPESFDIAEHVREFRESQDIVDVIFRPSEDGD